jgi:hypothetical protein
MDADLSHHVSNAADTDFLKVQFHIYYTFSHVTRDTHLLETDQLKGCVQDLKISLNDSKKIPEDSPIIFKIFPQSSKNILVDALA